MNTKIYIAPSRRRSSEALAAEQMSFKFFLQMCPWTARKSIERRAGCSKSPDQIPRSLADLLLCQWAYPTFYHPDFVQISALYKSITYLLADLKQIFLDATRSFERRTREWE